MNDMVFRAIPAAPSAVARLDGGQGQRLPDALAPNARMDGERSQVGVVPGAPPPVFGVGSRPWRVVGHRPEWAYPRLGEELRALGGPPGDVGQVVAVSRPVLAKPLCELLVGVDGQAPEFLVLFGDRLPQRDTFSHSPGPPGGRGAAAPPASR